MVNHNESTRQGITKHLRQEFVFAAAEHDIGPEVGEPQRREYGRLRPPPDAGENRNTSGKISFVWF